MQLQGFVSQWEATFSKLSAAHDHLILFRGKPTMVLFIYLLITPPSYQVIPEGYMIDVKAFLPCPNLHILLCQMA